MTAEPPTQTRRFRALNTQDQNFVMSSALSMTPASVSTPQGTLFRADIKVDPNGWNNWLVTVPYEKNPKPPQGQWTWSFDTTGGSFHIKASKQTVARYPPGARNHQQLIGVHDKEVDGADIVIPAMKINAEYSHPLGVVTLQFAKHIRNQTGKVNSTTMFTMPAGEVLFLGGAGSDGTNAEAKVSYHFACEENLQGLVVGTIAGIQKDGWDISWIQWKDAVDANRPVRIPEAVYIERVYDRVDLASALGFGG